MLIRSSDLRDWMEEGKRERWRVRKVLTGQRGKDEGEMAAHALFVLLVLVLLHLVDL